MVNMNKNTLAIVTATILTTISISFFSTTISPVDACSRCWSVEPGDRLNMTGTYQNQTTGQTNVVYLECIVTSYPDVTHGSITQICLETSGYLQR